MTKGYWMDRPLEQLTREELIDALLIMAALQEQESKERAEQADFLFDCMDTLAKRRGQ